MNKSVLYIAYGLFALFLLTATEGKCQVNDAGVWLSANVQKKFTQSLSLTFAQELRLMENVSEASTIFSDLGIEYKLSKHFKVAANYRLVNDRRLDDSYATYNRFYFDLSYRQKLKPFVVTLRERLQSEYNGYNTGEKVNSKHYSRTKATVKLDLDRRFTPYVWAELVHPLNDPAAGFFDKTRQCAGIEYQFTARHMIDLNYMIQSKFNTPKENDFIVGLGYYLTL